MKCQCQIRVQSECPCLVAPITGKWWWPWKGTQEFSFDIADGRGTSLFFKAFFSTSFFSLCLLFAALVLVAGFSPVVSGACALGTVCWLWLQCTARAHGLHMCEPQLWSRAQERKLSSCGTRAQHLRSLWDLPRPRIELLSPALQGGVLTTGPPGKPWTSLLMGYFYKTNDHAQMGFSNVWYSL